MTRREKHRELFIELINYQLKDHGVNYEQVKEIPTWYMDYKTTPEKEKEFQEYCVDRIREVLKINKTLAEKEAQWFILQWGLTTSYSDVEEQNQQKTAKGKKDSSKN